MEIIEILLLIIVGLVTYCVAGEGAWGAAITCLSVILSGLLAMNFFEPLCNWLLPTNPYWQARLDLIVLVGLFAIGVFALRAGADYLSPTYIGVHHLVHEGVRWACGVLTGYVTMAFLLTALHTAPLPRQFLGFRAERPNFYSVWPDRQWLGFTQYVTELTFAKSRPRIFDGPIVQLGDLNDPNGEKNQVWPSFPIRYATRRERGGSIAGGVAAPIRQIQQPKTGVAPSF